LFLAPIPLALAQTLYIETLLHKKIIDNPFLRFKKKYYIATGKSSPVVKPLRTTAWEVSS
jgi:hypothetical protein